MRQWGKEMETTLGSDVLITSFKSLQVGCCFFRNIHICTMTFGSTAYAQKGTKELLCLSLSDCMSVHLNTKSSLLCKRCWRTAYKSYLNSVLMLECQFYLIYIFHIKIVKDFNEVLALLP